MLRLELPPAQRLLLQPQRPQKPPLRQKGRGQELVYVLKNVPAAIEWHLAVHAVCLPSWQALQPGIACLMCDERDTHICDEVCQAKKQ